MLHPPLVHFAVACPCLALLAQGGELFSRKPWLAHAAASLWVVGFLSALGALATGPFLALHLGLLSQWTLMPPVAAAHGALRTHALLGLLSGALALLSLPAVFYHARGKPWRLGARLALGIALAASFLLTGREGGEMVYGSDEAPASPSPVSTPLVDFFSSLGDYHQTLVKMNKTEWVSRTHGGRWVNTFVSREAVEAYQKGDPMPLGAVVVKESYENEGGKPSTVVGPIYGMKKGESADSPQTGGWQYALKWVKPVPGNPEGITLPVTWTGGDAHLNSCVRCHGHFRETDYLSGVPQGFEMNLP